MNKYYVLTTITGLFGPYTFKKAIQEQTRWKELSIDAIILKEVIDTEGKEVK